MSAATVERYVRDLRSDARPLILDRAVAEIERELGHLGAHQRIAVVSIVERACREWPEEGGFW